MLDKIEGIKAAALEQLDGIDNARDLESWRIQYLGKKSLLTQILRGLAALSIEERKAQRRGTCKEKRKLVLYRSTMGNLQ